jgi:threonine dehydratase
VVCASASNLDQALSCQAAAVALNVTVVASPRTPVAKLDRIRGLGAESEFADSDFETAPSSAQRRGVRPVEDSLYVETCGGAAAIGLELAARNPGSTLF